MKLVVSIVHVVNLNRDGLLTQFKSGFLLSFTLEIINDTDNKVKPYVGMALLEKKIIMLPKLKLKY